MMESIFHSKIVSYLDGSLSVEEKSEFEAYVSTHPEFEIVIKSKAEELELLKSHIPAIKASRDILDALDSEIKTSVLNLLKQEPKNIVDRVKSKFEEWFIR